MEFYPLWFTYYQSLYSSRNRLVGPDRISSLYQIVVAINDDTLYASTVLDLSAQPLILTVPSTPVIYSVLTLDAYGNIIPNAIEAQAPAVFALTGPEPTATLPAGVIPVPLPFNFSVLIFRIDKFSPHGANQRPEAEKFRASLKTELLCEYLHQPCPPGVPTGGTALILPEAFFSVPYKTTADELIAERPITFLKQIQIAVASSNTPPLSAAARALSDRFDRLFGGGDFAGDPNKEAEFRAGAREAHARILDRYLTHLGPTNWIIFTNIGMWGDQVLDRAAITEFIQYGNDHGSAAYYQAFRDHRGQPLSGSPRNGYVIRFPPDGLPQAKRFWSLTAYTPDSIELVRNSADKYVVASYTPGLQFNADGSLSVHLATALPGGVPAANWLPIPRGPFNIMLRVYGPEGSVADDTYVPPGIVGSP